MNRKHEGMATCRSSLHCSSSDVLFPRQSPLNPDAPVPAPPPMEGISSWQDMLDHPQAQATGNLGPSLPSPPLTTCLIAGLLLPPRSLMYDGAACIPFLMCSLASAAPEAPCTGILGEGVHHLYRTISKDDRRTGGVFTLRDLEALPRDFLKAADSDLEAATYGMMSSETRELTNKRLKDLGMYKADPGGTVDCIRSTLCCKLGGMCQCLSHDKNGLCPGCAFVNSHPDFDARARRQASLQLRGQSQLGRQDDTAPPFLLGVPSKHLPPDMVKERDRRVAFKPKPERVKASSRPTAAAAKEYLKGIPAKQVGRLIASACPGQAETQTAASLMQALCSPDVEPETKELVHEMAQNLSRKPQGRRYSQKARARGINLMNAGGPQALRVMEGMCLVASQRRVRTHRNKAKVGYRYGGKPGDAAFDNQLQRAGEILRQGSHPACPVLICAASDGSAVTTTLEATYQAPVPADQIPGRIIVHGFTGQPLVLEGPTTRDIPQAMDLVSA